MPKRRKSAGVETTFRLGTEYRKELERRVAAEGKSLSEYLRHLVHDHLDAAGQDQLIDHIAEVRDEIRTLRNDLRIVLETVLVNVADKDPDEVKAAVRSKLGKQ